MKRILLLCVCVMLSAWTAFSSKPKNPEATAQQTPVAKTTPKPSDKGKPTPAPAATPKEKTQAVVTTQTLPTVDMDESLVADPEALERYADDIAARKDQLRDVEDDIANWKNELESGDYKGDALKEAGKVLDAEVALSNLLKQHIRVLENGNMSKILAVLARTHFAENAVDIAGMRFNLEADLADMKEALGKTDKFKSILAQYREKGLEQIRLKIQMQQAQMQMDKLAIERNALAEELDAAADTQQKKGTTGQPGGVI